MTTPSQRYCSLAIATLLAAVFSVFPANAQAPLVTYAFSVRGPGLVTVPLTSIPGNADPAFLHVSHRGQAIPVQVTGEALQFVAPASNNPASAESTYLVYTDTTRPGLRTTLPRAITTTFVWEHDRLYQSVALTDRGDRWFAGELRDDLPLDTVTHLPSSVQAGTRIHLHVTPMVRGNHTITAFVNGEAIGSVVWDDGLVSGPRNVALTLHKPVNPTDTLTFVGTYDDLLFLDRIEIPSLRVALPALQAPAVRTISRHDVRTGPTRDMRGASYVMITHAAFREALDPLITAHQQRGESVAVVDVQDIYDQFSHAERDPEAIRAFIRATQRYWYPTPQNVLLVGAGSVKMRVEAGQPDPTFIPPYLLNIDPKYGEVACDTCYTRGTPRVRDQLVPSIPLGRLPVHTLTEARIIVAKTVTALTNPPSGAWRQRAILMADDDDNAGAFAQSTEQAATLLKPAMQTQVFQYRPNVDPSADFYGDAEHMRRDAFHAWDAGAALLIYTGHGGLWQWGTTAPESRIDHLLGLYDADDRTNSDRQPILLAMDCLSGNWANPTLQTIDERLLIKAGGGIVAALTPTGSAVATRHAAMQAAMLPALVAGQPLGAAHLLSLHALAQQGKQPDLMFTYGILGDPAIALPQATTRTYYLSLLLR